MREGEHQPEEAQGFIVPDATELPGRSFVLEHPELADLPRETQTLPDGRVTKQTVTSIDGKMRWEKNWEYVPGFDGEGKRVPEAEVGIVDERIHTLNDAGLLVSERGRFLTRPHAWEKEFVYDGEGNRIGETSRTTEGVFAGSHSETKYWNEPVEGGMNQITEIVSTLVTQHRDKSTTEEVHVKRITRRPDGTSTTSSHKVP